MTETATGAAADGARAVPDFSRERPRRFWDPGRKLLRAVRDYQSARSVFAKKFAVLRHLFWSAVCSSDIPLNAKIGGGLLLPHPFGIVIHPDAVIGPNCLIMHGVTLGTNRGRDAPRLGAGVDIGPGAHILGKVEVGDGAVIGANAVVVKDVPAGALAVGIPAVIKSAREKPAKELPQP